jgi:hypothetical protein
MKKASTIESIIYNRNNDDVEVRYQLLSISPVLSEPSLVIKVKEGPQ